MYLLTMSPVSVLRSPKFQRLSAVIAVLALSMGAMGSSSASAQAARPALVTQAVNEAERVTLHGSTSPLATKAADRGAVSPSMSADRMLLLLKRSPEREQALRTQIQALHDTNSPSFHKWFTPAQFGAEWGAADSDIAAVTAWLQSHGFQVNGATAGKTAIEFSGTAGQVEEAFHTSIHLFEVNGEIHHANVSDPQIPAALAPVVAGVATLNDFHPKALYKAGPRGVYDASTHTIRPDLTAGGANSEFLYVGPADAATIYNSPNKALNPAATGTTFDGTGVKVGIVADSNISLAQNANYRKIFGLAANAPTVIIDGPTDPGENGDAVEAYLDTEVANGIAPGSKVYLYTAADTATDYGLDLATTRAVNDNIVDVLSVSFGQCEAGLAYPGNQFFESMWEQASAQGISVTVSSGDSGSAGCDDENTETKATYGLQVNGIASTAFNVAVGGTDFAALAGPDGSGANFNNYVSSSNTAGTLRSAKEYIPEVPWNNTFQNFPPGPLSGSQAAPSPYANIVGAGGGKSNCAQGYFGGDGNPFCIAGYVKPSWQSATGVPADGNRDLPDVSLFSANGLYYAAWGICTDQDKDSKGNKIADCTPGSNGLPANEFYIYGVGGTSASAPAFAGMLALVDQKYGRQGLANYVLYNLARSKPSIFHDVITGNNSVPCQGGTENCSKNSAGSYYLSGYNAATGYDLASGLGSVNASSLVQNWASTGLTGTTTKLTLTPTSIQHGEIVTADATVTSTNGIPAAGEVALSAYANPPSLPYGSAIGTYSLLDSGADAGSTGTLSINHLPGGTYKVIATYGGSPENSESVSAPVSVTVTPEPSTTAITVSAYDPANSALSSTTQYGYFIGITAHPYGNRSPIVNGVVDPDGTATGKITFAANGKTLETFYLDSRALATYSIQENNMLNAGKYTVSASYPGDNSLLASVGTQVLEITKAPTKITMTASADAYAGHPLTFHIKMTSDSAGIAPTGMVALEYKSTVLAEVPIVGVGAADSALATGAATITTGNLPLGTNDLVAVYLGDVNYGSSVSNGLEIKGRPYFTIESTSISIPSEHSTAAPYMVTNSVGGYAGTIDYTCALVGSYSEASPPECAMYPTSSATITANGTISPQVLVFGKGTKLPKGVTIGNVDSGPAPGPKLGIGLGATALACCLLFGIPAKRKGWKTILSVVLLLGAVSSFTACGSKGKFISSGTYTFQVIGTDSVDNTNTAKATLKVTVY